VQTFAEPLMGRLARFFSIAALLLANSMGGTAAVKPILPVPNVCPDSTFT
jgi:hypothetical protein